MWIKASTSPAKNGCRKYFDSCVCLASQDAWTVWNKHLQNGNRTRKGLALKLTSESPRSRAIATRIAKVVIVGTL